jgi:hypothetical protein
MEFNRTRYEIKTNQVVIFNALLYHLSGIRDLSDILPDIALLFVRGFRSYQPESCYAVFAVNRPFSEAFTGRSPVGKEVGIRILSESLSASGYRKGRVGEKRTVSRHAPNVL